ncbi:prepilin-type N-terminal cleavage/methylation domain-containing protein [Nitrospirillum sp. BR 11163]|uniref:prepilin-type N-terminal cleavage/methylation domain-containing protein n=1 Tax=Nitrospirillum sp. BR 11163 TaxID=3104323 RepID=UPI002AFF21F3|nr:prepilin-type N-terminal cleavage/methylation domain-containing protein [Nitrospirillum sp. BR 11163]MEA1674771.1 prepilin-type N-terminal cleavage/methylation domain-containing protein [Nitrospirillum sp. BR 11163]
MRAGVPPRQAGFTLVEVLVVLVILGILGAALALGIQDRLPGLRFSAAVSALEDELRSRQVEAMVTGQPVAFSLDDLKHPAGGAAGRRLRRIAAVALTIDGADGSRPDAVVFLAGGWSPGARIRLGQGDRAAIVRVDWPLGTVHRE